MAVRAFVYLHVLQHYTTTSSPLSLSRSLTPCTHSHNLLECKSRIDIWLLSPPLLTQVPHSLTHSLENARKLAHCHIVPSHMYALTHAVMHTPAHMAHARTYSLTHSHARAHTYTHITRTQLTQTTPLNTHTFRHTHKRLAVCLVHELSNDGGWACILCAPAAHYAIVSTLWMQTSCKIHGEFRLPEGKFVTSIFELVVVDPYSIKNGSG